MSNVCEQVVFASLKGNGVVTIVDDFQCDSFSLILSQVQLPLVLAGVQVVRTGDELVFLGVSQNNGLAADLSLSRNGVIKGNGNFLALVILQSANQLVVDFLSRCSNLNDGCIVFACNDLYVFRLICAPVDGISNTLNANLGQNSVVSICDNLCVLIHCRQVLCCSAQGCVLLNFRCTACKAANHNSQEQ